MCLAQSSCASSHICVALYTNFLCCGHCSEHIAGVVQKQNFTIPASNTLQVLIVCPTEANFSSQKGTRVNSKCNLHSKQDNFKLSKLISIFLDYLDIILRSLMGSIFHETNFGFVSTGIKHRLFSSWSY